MTDAIVIPRAAPLYAPLHAAATGARVAMFAGLPGIGKSLITQQTALMARRAGRAVSLLQWDVARGAFETPAIQARYPEVDGLTHVVIRKAVSLWSRVAVARIARETTGRNALLIIEAPLIGGRLIDLAARADDAAEVVLAQSQVFVPVPTVAVKDALRARRARDMAAPAHAGETANAPVHLLDAHVGEVADAARALGFAATGSDYDPDTYFAVYAHALRARAPKRLVIDRLFDVAGSAYDGRDDIVDLLPTPGEHAAAFAAAEAIGAAPLERLAQAWFSHAGSAV